MSSIFSRKAVIATIVLIVIVACVFISFGLINKKKPVSVPAIELKIPAIQESSLGLSVQGREIKTYTYSTSQTTATTTKLVFIGGIHGGYEWNSVYLAYKFMDYLKANPQIIPNNLSIVVIPTINPDGVFKVIGHEGSFTAAEVPTDTAILKSGRFNANKVDLNRNFDCRFQATSTWQGNIVSAGKSVFSEPEALAFKNFVQTNKIAAVIFWHSQSNGVYASQCINGILPGTTAIMNTYSKASGYPAQTSFDAYAITGAADDWLSSINIPAISVELKTHESVEWNQNLAGIKALFEYFGNK